MTSTSTYGRSESIRITFDPNRHHYHCTNRLYSDKKNQQMIDYENSLEAKGLMMHYDHSTWRMYERIMNYRCFLDNDPEQQDSDDMNLVDVDDDRNEESYLYKSYHYDGDMKQHKRDHNNNYDDGMSRCMSKENHDLTLTNLTTQMILHKTANHAKSHNSLKDTIKSSDDNDLFKQHHNQKNDNDVMKQLKSNKLMMMMTQAEQEISSLVLNPSLSSCTLPSPTSTDHVVSLSQNQKGKYNRHIDFSPKSIINDSDNNEGLSLLSSKLMTASDSCFMTMMTPPLPSSHHVPGLSYYDPNHQHIQDDNQHHYESDHVFELDL